MATERREYVATFGKSLGYDDGIRFAMRLSRAKLTLGELDKIITDQAHLVVRLRISPSEVEDADGQEIIPDTDITTKINAGCKGFTVRADYYGVTLADIPATPEQVGELEPFLGREGMVSFE